jgi:hypothetical protein
LQEFKLKLGQKYRNSRSLNITVASNLAAKINLNIGNVVFSVFLASNLWLALMPNQLINDNVSSILELVIAQLRDNYPEAQHQRYFEWWGIHRNSIMQNHCLSSKGIVNTISSIVDLA